MSLLEIPVKKAKAAHAPKDEWKKKGEANYNKEKDNNGQQYAGMKVGRSHTWSYDRGEWKERKLTPERWEVSYATIKTRAGKAPEESGEPVGTGYHWFILSHQFVHKLNANEYSTSMTGLKFKLANKRADKNKWDATDAAQRKHLIGLLEGYIKELQEEPEKSEIVILDFDFKNVKYKGYAVPLLDSCSSGACRDLDVTLNDEHYGIIRCTRNGWRMTDIKPQGLVNAIGQEIFLWYE